MALTCEGGGRVIVTGDPDPLTSMGAVIEKARRVVVPDVATVPRTGRSDESAHTVSVSVWFAPVRDRVATILLPVASTLSTVALPDEVTRHYCALGSTNQAMTTKWRMAPTMVQAWNTSWYPNTPGTGFGFFRA
jgi:hypothetical protein